MNAAAIIAGGLAVLVAVCACVAVRAANIPRIPVQGEWSGQALRTTVDSEIAAYFVEHYLSGRRIHPEFDTTIWRIENAITHGNQPRAQFTAVARRQSTDLATLMLWQSLLREPKNRQARTVYLEELARLKTTAQRAPTSFVAPASGHLIVFVPGWFYRSQPENGADFAAARRVLAGAGLRTVLLEVEENGTIERNGARIAAQLVTLSRTERNMILVSASKAAPEVAIALSGLRNTAASRSVTAWVNIGGVLRGSPLADRALTWPACWFVKLFVIRGGTFAGIKSMTTRRSAERADRLRLPPDILVMNYVGIPLSGQVTERARLGYALLRDDGPNDGLTNVIDATHPAGITLPELGLDHFFSDPDMHIKTLALSNTVIRLMEARKTSAGSTLDPGTY